MASRIQSYLEGHVRTQAGVDSEWRQRSGRRRNGHWRSGLLPAWPLSATWRLPPGFPCRLFRRNTAAKPFLAQTTRASAPPRSNARRIAAASVPKSGGPGRAATTSSRRPTRSGQKRKAGARPDYATRSKVVKVAGTALGAKPLALLPKKRVAPVTKRKPPAVKPKSPPPRSRKKANGWPVSLP